VSFEGFSQGAVGQARASKDAVVAGTHRAARGAHASRGRRAGGLSAITQVDCCPVAACSRRRRCCLKEAGAPADDHEEAGAAEEGAAEEGAAAGTAATAAAPAAPTVQAVSPSPPKLDGAPAALPEEGTVDRGEQAEERAAERGEPAGAFVDLAAGVEGGAIDSLAPVQGSGPAEAEAAAAGEDRAPITVAPTGIRASENPADHSVCQGC